MTNGRPLTAALSYAKRNWAVLPLLRNPLQRGGCSCDSPHCESLGSISNNALEKARQDRRSDDFTSAGFIGPSPTLQCWSWA
jgi:hypothetical protein